MDLGQPGAATSSPARVRQRISPELAKKINGRTTPSRGASAYPHVWSARDTGAPSGPGAR
jgi:hypothetical protein